jgi:glutaredoxin
MVIRVMTFEGCPNCQAATNLVEEVVRELHLPADIEVIQVNSEDEARRTGFLGSPTIQVNGRDIEVSRRGDEGTLACRVYGKSNGITGVPPKNLVVDAIQEAILNQKRLA